MTKFKLFFRKLKRLKYLSNLIKKTSVVTKLDKFWGFTSKDKTFKKVKKVKPIINEELKKDPLDFFDKKLIESEKEKEVLEPTKTIEKSPEDEKNYEYVNEKEFFKESVKDLRKLVYPHLDPITKRHYDEMKLLALGGKVAPNRKMPYKEFLQRQKALKRHLEKNKKLEDELGVKFTLDKKGGARFAQIHKRKDSKEKRKRKPLFDNVEKDGIYRIKF